MKNLKSNKRDNYIIHHQKLCSSSNKKKEKRSTWNFKKRRISSTRNRLICLPILLTNWRVLPLHLHWRNLLGHNLSNMSIQYGKRIFSNVKSGPKTSESSKNTSDLSDTYFRSMDTRNTWYTTDKLGDKSNL